ncbi:MAG: MerR family transcriptional regulator [Victivallaceae bacterium]|jgi:DNA-binding transcriptional MerR regulator
MNEKKTYSIVELAEVLNVPRTTLNDWLTRFYQYIECETRGKRKVYFDTSLEVLREISELRNSGMASPEIETELAKRHPVHAEIAPPQPEEETENGETAAQPEEKQELMPPVVRQQAEEIGRMLGKELQNIAERLEASKDMSKTFARRTMRWYILALVLIVAMGATAIVVTIKAGELLKRQDSKISGNSSILNKIDRQNDSITKELQQRDQLIAKQNQDLQHMSILLDKNSSDYQKNIEKLQQELNKQREDFKAMIEKASQSADTKTSAELAAIKDYFAKEKLEYISKLEVLGKETAERATLIEQLKNDMRKQSEEYKAALARNEKNVIDAKDSIINKLKEEFTQKRQEYAKKMQQLTRETEEKSKQIEGLTKHAGEQNDIINQMKAKQAEQTPPQAEKPAAQ